MTNQPPTYRSIAAELRRISSRIGQSTNPAWIREQLDGLATQMEEAERKELARQAELELERMAG